MFFKRTDHRKSSGGVLGIFRLVLSLFIIIILGLGLYQAYKSFSGIDPMKINPKSTFKNLLTSDSAYKLITGLLSFSPSSSLNQAKEILGDRNPQIRTGAQNPFEDKPKESPKFKFAVIADSHLDTADLSKALTIAKEQSSKFIIGIGDFSDVGTIEELNNTKKQFDEVGLPYYVTPGDHDLWDSRNKQLPPSQNFTTVFGKPPYSAFTYDSIRVILVFDTDNDLGLDELQLKWIDDELTKFSSNQENLAFVFAGTPLFHPSSDHVMGKTNPKLKNQAEHLSSIFKKAGINEVIAADTHFFSRYTEPVNNLKMTTVGAVTAERNPQTPRFAIVDVYDDGSYNIEEIQIR